MRRWQAKLKYQFDNLVSRGTGAMIAALALVSLAVILISGIIVALTGVHPLDTERIGFLEGSWLALMRTLDAGTMGGDTGWGFRLVMFGTTVGGILIISTLIGVLANGIQEKIEELRRGRSEVLEHGHTVILGWTEQIFTIIAELVEANANQKHSCIVVLAEQDKVEMEEQIRRRVGETGKTHVVCRTGNPLESTDLRVVNLNGSKSIIILSPETDECDSEVIKTALAITHYPDRRTEPYHIVAQLTDTSSLEAALVAGKDEVEWIVVSDFVARIIAQTCHQSGLSIIYTDLLDFAGDEMYFYPAANLVGQTFKEAVLAFENFSVLGLSFPGSECRLNPPMDTVIKEGSRLILVAEDDNWDMTKMSANKVIEEQIAPTKTEQGAAKNLLILGWNKLGPAIIHELSFYMTLDSKIDVVANPDVEPPDWTRYDLGQLTVTFLPEDTADRRTLDALDLGKYDHIVVLCYSDLFSSQKADAQTIITLLHLRDIADKHGYKYTIVSQMLDVRNRNLAAITRADDFIVSNRLISLMITQVAENKGLNKVFQDLFNQEGSEIYLKPVEEYVTLQEQVNYCSLVEAAARKGETALGYRFVTRAQDGPAPLGIHMNPAKSEQIQFQTGDKVIVLAES